MFGNQKNESETETDSKAVSITKKVWDNKTRSKLLAFCTKALPIVIKRMYTWNGMEELWDMKFINQFWQGYELNMNDLLPKLNTEPTTPTFGPASTTPVHLTRLTIN